MPSQTQVSIVIPVHNDEEWIAHALESCIAQSLAAVEVICVDDASTDGTREVIEQYAARDPRIRLISLETNQSAFQGRRTGIAAAEGEFVLFLDGDDELAPQAAELSLARARAEGADLVGFGVEVINPDGMPVGGYQARLRHAHARLEGAELLPGLFPVGKPAQGQLWRYLFRTSLLRDAYSMVPEGLSLRRVNDLPLMFMVAALAERFVSIHERLYRYYFRRGGSGHRVTDLAQFEFYLGAIDSINAIAPAVDALAAERSDAVNIEASYRSARLAIIGNVLGYLRNNVDASIQGDSVALLSTRATEEDLVLAAARFTKDALETLAEHGTRVEMGDRSVRTVLLVTATLTTGGVSGVLLSQARFLLAAGYKVVIAARRPGSDVADVPDGATFVETDGDDLPSRMENWAEICRVHGVDLIIDHQVLYSREWPAFALIAKALGVPTIGWIHNFALRPVYDRKTLSSFLATHLNVLATVVTLSPLDVAFWKLRGVPHAVYLPNPPSPMLLESAGVAEPRRAPAGRLELVWVGRLDEHTKQVRQLLDVAAELRRLTGDFHLNVIGPEWAGLTVEHFAAEVDQRGLSDVVTVCGPMRGEALVDAIDAADIFVTTSVIEGYQLTLAEAQSRGLPVVMYELPWLILVQGNEGIAAVPQGDSAALAHQIVALRDDAARYERFSAASLDAAERARTFDFGRLYQQLVEGELPVEFSPEPTLDDARQLIDWTIFFAERNAEAPVRKRGRARAARSVDRTLGARIERRATRMARDAVRKSPALESMARRIRRMIRR